MKQQRQTLQGFAGIANLYRSVITDCRRAMRTTILVLIMLFNNSYAQDSTPQTTKRIEMKTQFFFMNNTISGIFGLLENPVRGNFVTPDAENHLDDRIFDDSVGGQIIKTFNENVRFVDDYRTETQIAIKDSGVRILFINKETGEISYKEQLGYVRKMYFEEKTRKIFFVKNKRDMYYHDLNNNETRLIVSLSSDIEGYGPMPNDRILILSEGGTSNLGGIRIARLTLFDYKNDTFVSISDNKAITGFSSFGTYGVNEKVIVTTYPAILQMSGDREMWVYDVKTNRSIYHNLTAKKIRFSNIRPLSDSVFVTNRITSSGNYLSYVNLYTLEYKDVIHELSSFYHDEEWDQIEGGDIEPYDGTDTNIRNNEILARYPNLNDSVTYLLNIKTLEVKEVGMFFKGDKWNSQYGTLSTGFEFALPESGRFVDGGGPWLRTNRFFGPEMPMKTVSYKEANVKVYPNPTSGTVSISSPDPIKMVEVYDQTGRLVYKGQKTSLDLPKGINTVVVYTTNGISTQKVVSF